MTPQVYLPSPPAVSAKIIVVFSLVSRAGQLGTHNEEGGREGERRIACRRYNFMLVSSAKDSLPPLYEVGRAEGSLSRRAQEKRYFLLFSLLKSSPLSSHATGKERVFAKEEG